MSEEKKEDKDPLQAVKEAEARILKLQIEVHNLKQRIQLSESEERAEKKEYDKKVEENDEHIKMLKRKLQDLQISKTKGLKGDERIIAKAFSRHSREIGILAGKSGKEAIEILDGKVLDLIKKSNALTHELKVKEKKLAGLKDQVKDVAWNMYHDFEEEHTESETMQRVRDLENDYQKVEKNLMECQIINSKYKTIQEHLKKELLDYPSLLEGLEEKHREQQSDIDKLMASEEKAQERRETAKKELVRVEAEALKARHDKDKVINEYNKSLRPKHMASEMHSVELKDSEATEQWRKLREQQEIELGNLRRAFEKIKEAIGISDIEDAEDRFLSQKATKDDLSELVKKAEKKLRDLQQEALELQIQHESIKGAELASPQFVLERELEMSKIEQENQLKRKAAADTELERLNKLYADIKSGLWQQLQLMEKYMEETDEGVSTTPDEDAIVIVTKIEKLLEQVLEKLKDQDLEELKSKLKEEQFLQKIKPPKLVPSAGIARKLKPTEEEESTDDEDFEKKRTLLKKEAQTYAEMKKQQQGRGRMMML